ncbi:MAG: peptide chain release factor 2 [Bacilli bacterium]
MTLFDYAFLEEKTKELEAIQNDPDFWNDQKRAVSVVNEYNRVKDTFGAYQKIIKTHRDIDELLKSTSQEDSDMLLLIEETLNDLSNYIKELRSELYFTGKFDRLNAIVTIHPGAGGTESHDWADMLYRMYVRWAEKRRFKMQVIDYQAGDEAGIKTVTIAIKGKNVYGLLKGEKGVHRLVRISPFDSNSRRHTSFASVNVVPEFDNDINIEINDSDLKVDTYRSSGAGGQNVNKTESAVRITHIPTGIVVSCQVERSQISNREMAMNMLKGQLYQLEQSRKDDELKNIVGEQKAIEWGSQIRSYVFCPYTLVKDNRTNYSEGDVHAVMDGEIDGFINAMLDMEARNSKDIFAK